MVQSVDVAIIGAGTAGLAALREVRKRTEHFLIVNDGAYGTTCARVGCMPSKALIEAAKAFHHRRHLQAFGIRGADALSVDVAAVLARVRRLRDRFVAGVLAATEDLGARSVAGRARLAGPGRVEIDGRMVEAKRIVLATGSRPIVPGGWRRFGDRVVTTDTLFERETLPQRIAVVGLGAIGVEIAQALSRLGLAVAGFDAADRLAGLSDGEIDAALRAALADEFAIHTGAPAELSETAAGITVVGSGGRFVADLVIAALGRRPNVDDIGLETLGVALDDRGLPPVDPTTMRIADLPVFLAGDANGFAPLLHEAADEGHIAGINAVTAEPRCFRRRTPLAIVFAEPDVAVVGARYADLDLARTVIGEVDFARQGRARTAERNRGLLRVYADCGDGRLLGAAMCAPAGEHIVHLLALAIEQRLTVQELLGMPFYHPVIEEGLRTALRDAARQLPAGPDSDLASCQAIGAEALE
ncbi:MAG: dihydrolipoyl dehydrogenase [Rhodospirillales bacterium]